MEEILNNCEKALQVNLEQLEETKALIHNALDAVRRAQLSINELPRFTSEHDLITYVLSNLDVKENNSSHDTASTDVIKIESHEDEERPKIDSQTIVSDAQGSDYTEADTVKDPPIEGDETLQTISNETQEQETSTDDTREGIFPCPDLKSAQRIRVDVASSLANDCTFWCVPCTADVRKQQNQISERLKSSVSIQKTLSPETKIDKNSLFCVFSKSENLWLRAYVEKEVSEEQVQLRYVDTGTQEAFIRSRLIPLPTELQDIEFIAYFCSLFPDYTGKLPYEAKWKFNDTTKGILTHLYLEQGAKSGFEPISCFRLESGDCRLDVRTDIWNSVQMIMESKEDFPLPAKDIRKFEKPSNAEITNNQKGKPGTENDVQNVDQSKEVSSGGPKDGGAVSNEETSNASQPKLNTAAAALKQTELSETSWADLCSPGADEDVMDYSPLPDFPLPESYKQEMDRLETASDDHVDDSKTTATSLDNSRPSVNESDPYQDTAGEKDNDIQNQENQTEQRENRPSRISKHADRPLFQPSRNGHWRASHQQEADDQGSRYDKEKTSERNGGRSIERADIESHPRGRSSNRERNEGQTGRSPFYKNQRPGNGDGERPLERKPQWRFSIKRLGLSSSLSRQQWIDVQLKGLSFKLLFEKPAKYIVLWTTQQRLEYLYKFGNFTPTLDNTQIIEDTLLSFDQQPIFIIFVRFDRKYSSSCLSGVGLVTSPFFIDDRYTRDKGRVKLVKFNCDLLCTAMLRQQYSDPYEDGEVISFEEGVRLVNCIKDAVQSNEVENTLEFKGDFYSNKGFSREEKGFGLPNSTRFPVHTQPAIRRNDVSNFNPKVFDSEGENWDEEETETTVDQGKEDVKLNAKSETVSPPDITPFTLREPNIESERDLQAEMEIFGLDDDDVL